MSLLRLAAIIAAIVTIACGQGATPSPTGTSAETIAVTPYVPDYPSNAVASQQQRGYPSHRNLQSGIWGYAWYRDLTCTSLATYSIFQGWGLIGGCQAISGSGVFIQYMCTELELTCVTYMDAGCTAPATQNICGEVGPLGIDNSPATGNVVCGSGSSSPEQTSASGYYCFAVPLCGPSYPCLINIGDNPPSYKCDNTCDDGTCPTNTIPCASPSASLTLTGTPSPSFTPSSSGTPSNPSTDTSTGTRSSSKTGMATPSSTRSSTPSLTSSSSRIMPTFHNHFTIGANGAAVTSLLAYLHYDILTFTVPGTSSYIYSITCDGGVDTEVWAAAYTTEAAALSDVSTYFGSPFGLVSPRLWLTPILGTASGTLPDALPGASYTFIVFTPGNNGNTPVPYHASIVTGGPLSPCAGYFGDFTPCPLIPGVEVSDPSAPWNAYQPYTNSQGISQPVYTISVFDSFSFAWPPSTSGLTVSLFITGGAGMLARMYGSLAAVATDAANPFSSSLYLSNVFVSTSAIWPLTPPPGGVYYIVLINLLPADCSYSIRIDSESPTPSVTASSSASSTRAVIAAASSSVSSTCTHIHSFSSSTTRMGTPTRTVTAAITRTHTASPPVSSTPSIARTRSRTVTRTRTASVTRPTTLTPGPFRSGTHTRASSSPTRKAKGT